jgi:hypothetical protein
MQAVVADSEQTVGDGQAVVASGGAKWPAPTLSFSGERSVEVETDREQDQKSDEHFCLSVVGRRRP